jgi:hypothetical protein
MPAMSGTAHADRIPPRGSMQADGDLPLYSSGQLIEIERCQGIAPTPFGARINPYMMSNGRTTQEETQNEGGDRHGTEPDPRIWRL